MISRLSSGYVEVPPNNFSFIPIDLGKRLRLYVKWKASYKCFIALTNELMTKRIKDLIGDRGLEALWTTPWGFLVPPPFSSMAVISYIFSRITQPIIAQQVVYDTASSGLLKMDVDTPGRYYLIIYNDSIYGSLKVKYEVLVEELQ